MLNFVWIWLCYFFDRFGRRKEKWISLDLLLMFGDGLVLEFDRCLGKGYIFVDGIIEKIFKFRFWVLVKIFWLLVRENNLNYLGIYYRNIGFSLVI